MSNPLNVSHKTPGGKMPAALAIVALFQGCSGDGNAPSTQRIEALRAAAPPAERDWRSYLGDTASNQYSPLTRVTTDNVSQLEIAWQYDPQDAGDYDTFIPTNPLIVHGVLYGLSARKNLFALDAASGEEIWMYEFDRPYAGGKGAGRGLVYWEGETADGQAARWILAGLGDDLFAVDTLTGQLAKSFGNNGHVDLRVGLDRPLDEVQVNVVAPGTLYGDLLIQGFGTSEFYDATPGYIRAFHIPSGELRWTFRTIPAPGEYGADTWPEEYRDELGGANSWGGITVDEERGIAFVPTGSASYDYFGGNRAGDNLFANSLVALDASTGERLWHYQIVRHDLWDRDLPTPPNLVTLQRGGESIPAVSQATKSGHLFVFHRETGQPLFPIEEVPVSGSGVAGEHPPTTQPLPSSPPPFAKQRFELSDISPQSTEYVSAIVDGMTTGHPFPVPDEDGIVVYPGLDGGAEWGGQAWDADNGMLFVNTNEAPWHYTMLPQTGDRDDIVSLEFAYLNFCGGCHGADRRGSGDIFPSLVNISDKYWPWELWAIIRDGRGRMPGQGAYPWYYRLAPFLYLYTAGDDDIAVATEEGEVTGYIADGFHELTDEFNLPGSKPPWGSLVAIDIAAGDIAWKVPLGDCPNATAMGLSGLVAVNYGGPVVTASGLVFIAATPDNRIRAFSAQSGETLWEAELPAAGFATPAVYEAGGRQFIVIAAGGGRLKQPSGSAYVAFALPAATFSDKEH